ARPLPRPQQQTVEICGLAGLGLVAAAELHRHVGERVSAIGWFVSAKAVSARSGEPMEFASFEDTTALYETTFFPGAYRRFCHLLDRSGPLLLRGRVEESYGAVTLTVESASRLTLPAPTSERTLPETPSAPDYLLSRKSHRHSGAS
ncbi:MAG: hypothetical protein ACE5HV_14885, partial [Acidobacteriota bacterium]